MVDLSVFADGSFDLIIHPVSNCLSAEIMPVWKEAFRVLRRGGVMLAGFDNPALFLLDDEQSRRDGILQVKYHLPYSGITSLDEETRHRWLVEDEEPACFSHSLSEQIGGQLSAGFVLTGFFEDNYPEDTPDDERDPITEYMDIFIATRSVKP